MAVKIIGLLMTMLLSVVSVEAQEQPDTLAINEAEHQADSITTDGSPSTRRRLSKIRRTIRGFDRLNKSWIEPQHYVFTAMMQVTHTYDLYKLRGTGDDAQSMTFTPDFKLKVGPYLGWKWFFAGYTFELGNISLNKLKQELDLSIYSSQVGVDLFYRRTGTEYKLRNAYLGKGIDTKALDGVPFDGLRAGITGMNVYYIFNHGRFSYPAAFSQSTIQKVSCGSPMAGIGYTRHSLELDYGKLQKLVDERMKAQTVELDSGLMFKKVNYTDYSLSGGYAYNWVLAKEWLFAASGQAAIAYKKSEGDVEGNLLASFDFKNVNLDMIWRFGLVYNCMRWYAGASVILHSYNYNKPRFSTNNTFGSMNVYIGYNFGLKKKYKELESEK